MQKTELIKQWKGLSQLTTIPAETLRYWHKTIKPCPHVKTCHSKQGRVVFDPMAAILWLKEINKMRQSIVATY